MTAEQIKKQESELAAKVMDLSIGKLLLRYHYFSLALCRLAISQLPGKMMTDGKSLCYDAQFILERYKLSDTMPVHDILHSVLHNLFRHWNIGKVKPSLWDCSCDIAVEALICNIAPDLEIEQNADKRKKIIRELSSQVKPLTAEKLYAYFSRQQLSEQTAQEYIQLFSVDEHRLWHKNNDERELEPEEQLPTMPVSESDEQSQQTEQGRNEQQGSDSEKKEQCEENQSGERSNGDAESSHSDSIEKWLDEQSKAKQKELEDSWKQIAKQVQSELEAFGRSDDPAKLTLVDILEHIGREKTDYRAFLRRFAVQGEVMKSDLDAFDVNFYCYGLKLYGDVALIEPPEYKEVKRIKDLVIAIDTSASVGRETVRAFVRKTYSILKTEESFFSRINIHILQCDIRIQDIAVMTCEQELERYIDALELKGFGGTDFRPVFEYIEEQRAQGKLSELKGMIYFTDGLGTFPEKAPDYETAFVFLQGDYEKDQKPEVPPWAVRIMLDEGDVLDV
ncbi:MAG: hypothetical protein II574_04515 [Ruminococcus sp.]|nr:hypothetical protein [Ruminococcus sp.]